ncbi:MAG: hypothetical protein AAF317_04280 [Pseudomonadota bacterium]
MQNVLEQVPTKVLQPVLGAAVLGVCLNFFKLVVEDKFRMEPGAMDIPALAILPFLALFIGLDVTCLRRRVMEFVVCLMVLFSAGFASQEQALDLWETINRPADVVNDYASIE